MLAIVCPGQGSQTPGFLTSWLEEPALASRLAELSDAAGKDLAWLGTEADEETIKDTAHAQRLIVAAGLLAADALFGDDGAPADAVYAGHSVGELTAAEAARWRASPSSAWAASAAVSWATDRTRM